MRSVELINNASIVLRECLAINPSEQLLVVTDTLQPLSIGESLCAAARSLGAEAALMVMTPRSSSRQDIPRSVAEGIKSADAVIIYTAPSLYRAAALREAREKGARLLSLSLCDPSRPQTMLPELIESYFLRGAGEELGQIHALTTKLGKLIEDAKRARVTAPAGTDLTLELGNKVTVNNSLATRKGQMASLPPGVTAHAPAPRGAKGVVVVDVSIPPIGHLRTPIKLTVHDRVVTKIEGGEDADTLRTHLETFNDDTVYNCPAEWGFGTHSRAIISGNFLEEERISGYAHVALGDDVRFDGGKIKSPVHLDGVIRDASLEIDGKLVIDRGKFLI